jgi:hypothetical protein
VHEGIGPLVAIAAWVFLQVFLLPRLGLPT